MDHIPNKCLPRALSEFMPFDQLMAKLQIHKCPVFPGQFSPSTRLLGCWPWLSPPLQVPVQTVKIVSSG